MEIICLDTNVLIAHKRAKKDDKDKSFLFRLTTKPYQFAVSSITVYELLRGDNQGEDVYWKAMFSNMTVLDFDSNCAEYAAKIYQDLKTRGLLSVVPIKFVPGTVPLLPVIAHAEPLTRFAIVRF